jgi:hypothetical protein
LDGRTPTIAELPELPGLTGRSTVERKGGRMVPQWRTIVSGSSILFAAALSTPQTLLSQEQGAEAGGVYESQMSPGEVKLEITPVWEGDALSFRIAANTHSVDLGALRLDELLRLMASDTTWEPAEAGSLGGHHAQTTVRFRLPSRPESFVLEIRDLPDVPLRRLVWPQTPETQDQPETVPGA